MLASLVNSSHISGRLATMKLNTFLNPACWEKYNGINISFMPAYNLIRLEGDPTLSASLQDEVMTKTMWQLVRDHQNVFFAYCRGPDGATAPWLSVHVG